MFEIQKDARCNKLEFLFFWKKKATHYGSLLHFILKIWNNSISTWLAGLI